MYNYITHKENPKQRYHRFHTISIYTVEINVDKDNPKNEFFFNKDGKIRMENLYQYGQFWVDYSDIWLKIKADFGDNYKYTSKLMKSMVREVFKIRPFSTVVTNGDGMFRWERYNKR